VKQTSALVKTHQIQLSALQMEIATPQEIVLVNMDFLGLNVNLLNASKETVLKVQFVLEMENVQTTTTALVKMDILENNVTTQLAIKRTPLYLPFVLEMDFVLLWINANAMQVSLELNVNLAWMWIQFQTWFSFNSLTKHWMQISQTPSWINSASSSMQIVLE
jgi:hypothetical protein